MRALVGGWTHGKLSNSPAEPSTAYAQVSQHLRQHSVRIQHNFPFSKASQQGAECSSTFAEPLTLERARLFWGEAGS